MTDHNARQAGLTDAEINERTLERLGKWPSFEAQSWACKVVHALAAHSADARNVATRQVQRYDLQAGDGPGIYEHPDNDGEWVKYADITHLLAAPAPKQEALGPEFEQVLYENLSKLYIEDAAPAPAAQAEYMTAYEKECQSMAVEGIAYWKQKYEDLLAQQSATPAVPAIKAMVDRFLGWKLPRDFSPDCGISFTPPANPEWGPCGTNLLNADQARQMLEYVCATPAPASQAEIWLNITPSNGEVAAFSLAPIKGLDWHRYVRQQSATPPECTCPSGNGSLRHPCPVHSAEPMARFCPQCGLVGEVGDGYRDCCPDGSSARIVPKKFAEQCRDLFRMAVDGIAQQATPAANALLAGHFVRRSMHGPWVEVDPTKESGTPLYLGPADAASEADKRDAKRYRKARTLPLVWMRDRIAPQRPDKFDALIDAELRRERQQGADRG